MLSDEERKTIDLLKNIDKQKCVMLECPVVKNNIERQLKIIELNRIIRKQSKEIEELNLKNEKLYKDNFTLAQEIKEFIEGTNDVKYYSTSFIKNHYISKDKLIELREIDNIDLIQCKLRKLLEE